MFLCVCGGGQGPAMENQTDRQTSGWTDDIAAWDQKSILAAAKCKFLCEDSTNLKTIKLFFPSPNVRQNICCSHRNWILFCSFFFLHSKSQVICFHLRFYAAFRIACMVLCTIQKIMKENDSCLASDLLSSSPETKTGISWPSSDWAVQRVQQFSVAIYGSVLCVWSLKFALLDQNQQPTVQWGLVHSCLKVVCPYPHQPEYRTAQHRSSKWHNAVSWDGLRKFCWAPTVNLHWSCQDETNAFYFAAFEKGAK